MMAQDGVVVHGITNCSMMTPLKAVLNANTADAATALTPNRWAIRMKQNAVMMRQIALTNKERVNRHRFIENGGEKGVSREIPVFGWAQIDPGKRLG